ncbi:MAG: BrnT family toxin [Candidatus Rokubacteria bacterium]|nr:BrnT family toxin [Candidatus Rokubacteria bacterium]
MSFEWDEAKARANLLKHGVDFEDAIRIFEGPTLEHQDTRRDYREVRVQALGQIGNQVLFVVYVRRGRVRRIISARGAGSDEREAYRQAIDTS